MTDAGSPPDAAEIGIAAERTWPPAATRREGPWLFCEGAGGGKRVSATRALGPVTEADLAHAETEMRDRGETPLFFVRQENEALDALLDAAGYGIIDPTLMWLGATAEMQPEPFFEPICHRAWPPTSLERRIWEAGGIGPGRVAVMERAAPPKTALLARSGKAFIGTAFVAGHDRIAMVHAVEVLARWRRRKAAVNLMGAAAEWAQDMALPWIALLATEANAPATRLYRSLGMQVVGQYHYRGAHH